MMTEAQLYAAIEELIKSNKALVDSNQEKVQMLYSVVVEGDPKNNIPSMLEVIRNQEEDIRVIKSSFSKVIWIMVGVAIPAVAAFTWLAVGHIIFGK